MNDDRKAAQKLQSATAAGVQKTAVSAAAAASSTEMALSVALKAAEAATVAAEAATAAVEGRQGVDRLRRAGNCMSLVIPATKGSGAKGRAFPAKTPLAPIKRQGFRFTVQRPSETATSSPAFDVPPHASTSAAEGADDSGLSRRQRRERRKEEEDTTQERAVE